MTIEYDVHLELEYDMKQFLKEYNINPDTPNERILEAINDWLCGQDDLYYYSFGREQESEMLEQILNYLNEKGEK